MSSERPRDYSKKRLKEYLDTHDDRTIERLVEWGLIDCYKLGPFHQSPPRYTHESVQRLRAQRVTTSQK